MLFTYPDLKGAKFVPLHPTTQPLSGTSFISNGLNVSRSQYVQLGLMEVAMFATVCISIP